MLPNRHFAEDFFSIKLLTKRVQSVASTSLTFSKLSTRAFMSVFISIETLSMLQCGKWIDVNRFSLHIVARVKFALLHSEAAHVKCTSSIALVGQTMNQFSWKNCLKVIPNKRRLRCGCGVIKHGRRGEMRGRLELFMSSNLIKLAPKHFLIFLICLDNPIYAKNLDGGMKICFGFVLHEIRLRFRFL